MKYLGIPYVWAGATPSGGFDCSGLVLYVYAKFGVQFPHGATMQAHMGDPVSLSQAQPADLVFFGTRPSTTTSASTSATASSSRRRTPATSSRSAGSPGAAARSSAATPSGCPDAPPRPAAAHCRRPARRGTLRACLGTYSSSSLSPASRSCIGVARLRRPQGRGASPSTARRLQAHHAAGRRPQPQGRRGHGRGRAPLGRRRAAHREHGAAADLAGPLQVVMSTFNEAMEPFYLLTGWLSGEQGLQRLASLEPRAPALSRHAL